MKIIATMCAILTANLAMAAPCVLPSVCEAGRDCSPVPLRIDIGGNPPGSISTNLGAFEVVNTATAGAVTARVPMANGQNWRVVSPLDRIEASVGVPVTFAMSALGIGPVSARLVAAVTQSS